MLSRLLIAVAFAALAVPASAQSDVEQHHEAAVATSVQSPGGILKVDISLNGEGRVGYMVSRQGRPVIAESHLGFLFTDQPQMLRNFAIVGQKVRDHDETWETPWGEDRRIRDHYRELLRRNYIWTPAMVAFRRDPLERVGGFNGDVNAAADYDVYLHLARHYPVYDHAQVVAHYRKHDANMSGNAARMLRETLAVMKSQRPFLAADEASVAAYEEGWRAWQEFYGEHLVDEIRAAVRGYRWIDALTKAAVLGRYHPRGLWHHARHKSQLTLQAATRHSTLRRARNTRS